MDDRLARLDLNLLMPLTAILEERSVSRAAAKLQVGQPAVSVALRRLRIHFGDEILVRHGNAYELTPLALDLTARAAAAVSSLSDVFVAPPPFDPSESSREFVVRGSDHLAATIGVHTCRIAELEAPDVSFRFRNFMAISSDEEVAELDRNDLSLLPPGLLPGVPHEDVLWDHWVVVADAANPALGDAITLQQMGELPWIVTHQSRSTPRPALVQLQMLGVHPRVVGSVDSFAALPLFIAGTERIALMPSRLAEALAPNLGLRIMPCPYEAVNLTVTMYWHAKHSNDPAHRWMRRVIRDAGRAASHALVDDAVPDTAADDRADAETRPVVAAR